MKTKCILTVSISLMLFSIGAQTKNIEITNEEENILFDALRPKTRSWDQLNELMLQVMDDATINEVIDCSFIHESSSPTENSNQNILYHDYSWNIYESDYGSTCIELIKPNIGFLSDEQSKALLLASKGFGFERLGLWEEVRIYNDFIKSITPICEPSTYENKNSRAGSQNLIYTNEKLKDQKIIPTSKYIFPVKKEDTRKTSKNKNYKFGNKIHLEKDSCYMDINKRNKSSSLKTGIDGLIGTDDRLIYPDANLSYMVYLEQKAITSTTCKNSGTGFYLNPYSIVTAGHMLYWKKCQVIKFEARMVDPSNPDNPVEYRFFIKTPKLNKLNISARWKTLNNDPNHHMPLNDVKEDYAVLKLETPNFRPFFPNYTIKSHIHN